MNKSLEQKCDVCFINDKYRGTDECVFCRLSRIEKENAELKQTVSQRNIQIADLKHRLEVSLPQDRPSEFRQKENAKIIRLVDKFIVGTNTSAYELSTKAKRMLEKANSYL